MSNLPMTNRFNNTRRQQLRGSVVRATMAVALVGVVLAGCASPKRNVPFNVQSDPLGAYVMFQVKDREGVKTDWIYLGNTPLVTTRQYTGDQLDKKATVTLRVMKEGFFDQTRVFKGAQLREESKDKGRIFWNPRLVPSN